MNMQGRPRARQVRGQKSEVRGSEVTDLLRSVGLIWSAPPIYELRDFRMCGGAFVVWC